MAIAQNPLSVSEIDQVSLLLGYLPNDQRINYASQYISDYATASIRKILAEIFSYDDLLVQTLNDSRVTRIEDIYLNPNQRENILEQAQYLVNRIGKLLRMQVIKNYYEEENTNSYMIVSVR